MMRCPFCQERFSSALDMAVHIQTECKKTNGPKVASHLDHSSCEHPRTKTGRAGCRKANPLPS